MRGWPLIAVFFLLGCLGADRTFPDESAQTTTLRINAYTDIHSVAPHTALIEISGVGADGEAKAFRGEVRVVLAKQESSDPEMGYHAVQEWTLTLTPSQFSSQTVPYYKHVVRPPTLADEGTYQATATATIGGRSLEATSLFAYVRTSEPAS